MVPALAVTRDAAAVPPPTPPLARPRPETSRSFIAAVVPGRRLSRLGAAALIAVSTLSGCAAGDAPASGDRGAIQTAPAAPPAENKPAKDLVVTRTFSAPIERVWAAWTDPASVMQWWGPTGFTSPIARMDVRVGGTSLVSMQPPQGPAIYNTWNYRLVEPLRRLEFILNFADSSGTRIDPTTLGMPPGVPQDVHHVITFARAGDGRTELSVTERGYTSDQFLEISRAGLDQSLDKLAASFLSS